MHPLVEAEWASRKARGFPPYHALSTNDLGFQFNAPNDYELEEGIKAFLDKDYEKVEDLWQFRYTDVAGVTIFNKEFHEYCEELTYDDLPLVTFIREVPNTYKISYLACDGNYFEKFGDVLLRSLASPTHVHLMDADPAYAVSIIGDNGLSVEYPKAGPEYYHSVRFIRFKQLLDTGIEGVLLDVDAIANRHPLTIPSYPTALRMRPARLEPWNQFNASVVVGNDYAMQYWKRVAGYIYHFWKVDKLRWQIDQTALYCVWTQLQNEMQALGPDIVDYDYTPEGVIWCNSGKNKWLDKDPDRQVYRDRFDEIKRELNGKT